MLLMRSIRGPWLLGTVLLGLMAVHAGGCGCGGNGANTTQSGATGGAGAGGKTSSSKSTATSSSSTTTSGMGGGSSSSSSGGAVCGDGMIEGTEACDLGMANGTQMGCDSSCNYDCGMDADCNKLKDPCLGAATCVSAMVMGQMVKQCKAGTALMQGTSCGTNQFCVNMNCVAPSCGDDVLETPEECDTGSMNGPGTGCENTCKFSCLATDPTRNCSSTNPCVGNGMCDATKHTCTAGSPVTDGTTCPGGACMGGNCIVTSCTGATACALCAGGLCSGNPQACNPSTCGDGCVDASKGEQCEPPNSATCDASCHFAPAVCGDGVVQKGEQCDDGNKLDLDGCDSHCNYEVVARMSAIAIQGTPAPAALGCMPATNALGAKAITGVALNQLNGVLTTDVDTGVVNVTTQLIGLGDLTGVTSTGFTMGIIDAVPDPAKGVPMNNPIDWWFLANHSTVSMGLPTGVFNNVMLTNRQFAGTSASVSLTLNLAGTPAQLTMTSAHVGGTLNGSPAPNVPAPPPANLAAGLTVFQSITANGFGQGLCGNITVASLAAVPLPGALSNGGATGCDEGYTYCGDGNPVSPSCNSLLDAIVGGCHILNGLITAINPTQPDVPANAAALMIGANMKVNVTAQNGTDAYSAFLSFAAVRAHLTGETCAVTSDCQTGKTCTAGVCM
jgi:cysteine-rich repeat protein